jgi:hypothetical protein
VSEKELLYDVRLEEKLELTKLQIWLNEELQIQPTQFHELIIQSVKQ